MKILRAKYILICNQNFDILQDKAIAFGENIERVGDFDDLLQSYPDAEIYDYRNCIAMPGFVNPHVHLEYSANQTRLVFGDYLNWVQSIIANRSELSAQATQKLISDKITEMMSSGVTSIGEISSFGIDLDAVANSAIRAVFFNEILGSNEAVLEKNYANFISRYEASCEFKNARFIPAISVHSPYSTHINLAKKAVDFAKKNKLIISTHFMESKYEQKWLNKGKGGFKKWLKSFNKNAKPFYDESSFVSLFSGVHTLFTHCVYVGDFAKFDPKFHHITHCAVSNRMLGKKALNLNKVRQNGLNLSIGTDGLSSNISLNFFDELINLTYLTI